MASQPLRQAESQAQAAHPLEGEHTFWYAPRPPDLTFSNHLHMALFEALIRAATSHENRMLSL